MTSLTFEQLLIDMIFAGVLQVMFAVLAVGVICLRRDRRILLHRFVIFNLFLLGWSAFGNVAWNYLTAHRITVLDDAPVWSAFFPVGRVVLDHASGGRDGWQLLDGATLSKLHWWWVATAFPVWLLAIVSSRVYLHIRLGHYARVPR